MNSGGLFGENLHTSFTVKHSNALWAQFSYFKNLAGSFLRDSLKMLCSRFGVNYNDNNNNDNNNNNSNKERRRTSRRTTTTITLLMVNLIGKPFVYCSTLSLSNFHFDCTRYNRFNITYPQKWHLLRTLPHWFRHWHGHKQRDRVK